MSNSDSELEEDEEEILVYVEFDNCATNDVFSSENLKLDMLGLDSDHPVMQVNGKFFQGAYEDAVGTYMFFERDDHPTIDDPVFDKIPTLKYFNKTRKVLRMQRAFVTPRYEVVGDSEHSKCVPNLEIIKEAGVPSKYQEEALAFWDDARNTRISALNEYLRKQEFRKGLRARGFEPESESEEDNPFAMYKNGEEAETSKEIESDGHNDDLNSEIDNLENTLQTTEINKENGQGAESLNVIDPGPSTSKDSMPWIENDMPQKQSKSTISEKIKSIGRVREKNTKGKVQKKTVKKRTISMSEKLFKYSSSIQSESIDPIESNSSDITSTHQDGTDKNIPSKSNTEELRDIVEMLTEQNDKLLAKELNIEIPSISEKERRKQERREAKMREISEQLKAYSETSSQPPNS